MCSRARRSRRRGLRLCLRSPSLQLWRRESQALCSAWRRGTETSAAAAARGGTARAVARAAARAAAAACGAPRAVSPSRPSTASTEMGPRLPPHPGVPPHLPNSAVEGTRTPPQLVRELPCPGKAPDAMPRAAPPQAAAAASAVSVASAAAGSAAVASAAAAPVAAAPVAAAPVAAGAGGLGSNRWAAAAPRPVSRNLSCNRNRSRPAVAVVVDRSSREGGGVLGPAVRSARPRHLLRV